MIKTEKEETTTLRKIDPAQFVSFRYRDSEGEYSKRDVLALAYEDERNLLHALDLDKFSDQNIIDTAKELAQLSQDLEEFSERFTETEEVLLENVQDNEVEDWYDLNYSPDRYEENPYRTFRKDRMRNLREIKVIVV